ncbi:MAG: hypothetical protein E7231_01190 [Cellulosilyticum sp.]|nr:hypothetical protein [Cellulosilyticum sp.]
MKRVILALTTILIMFTFVACGSSLYEGEKSGYTKVTNVTGTTFEVSSSWNQSATAIFTIKEDDVYDGLYVKKSDDSYLLFDMNNILIAVGRTNFDFEENETVENLAAHDINNVWLSSEEKKLDYESGTKDGVYKLIASAKADYSVTPTQYATFKGYISNVKSGDMEYSMFVGAMTDSGSLTKTQNEICEHIAKTFRIVGEGAVEEVEEDTETAEVSTEETLPSEEVVEEKPVEDVTEEVVEPTEEVVEEQTEQTETDEDTTEEIVVESTEEESDNDKESEEIVVESEDEEPTEEETKEESTEEKPVEQQTASYTTFTYDDAKNSSTYKPLNTGEAGKFYIFEKDDMISAAVRVDAIHTGTEAERLILTYNGRKTSPSVGTEFVVVEYSSTADPRVNYIDCKFLGADGENLNYLGVAYPSKCYDMYDNIKVTDGIYSKIYAYYEVPIGTREYLLKFGSRVAEKTLGTENSLTANYIVDTGYRAKSSREQLKENRK